MEKKRVIPNTFLADRLAGKVDEHGRPIPKKEEVVYPTLPKKNDQKARIIVTKKEVINEEEAVKEEAPSTPKIVITKKEQLSEETKETERVSEVSHIKKAEPKKVEPQKASKPTSKVIQQKGNAKGNKKKK